MKKSIVAVCAIFVCAALFISCGGKKNEKLVYWSMGNEAEPQGQVIAEAQNAGGMICFKLPAAGKKKTPDPQGPGAEKPLVRKAPAQGGKAGRPKARTGI